MFPSNQGTSVLPSPLLFLLHSHFFQITSLEAQVPWIHLALSLVYLYPFPRASTCLRSNLITTNHWVRWPGYIKNCSISASWALKFSPPCYPPTRGKRLIVWLGEMNLMMILRGYQPSRGRHTKCGLTPCLPLCPGQRWCGNSNVWSELFTLALVL